MVTAVKKRKEEKAKASKEKAEKFKKSVGKAVTKMKAKMHGGMADYAGKRKLIPAKTKMKKPDGRKKIYRDEGGKDALAKDKAKFAKAKDKKQTSANIKVSMMGGGAKEARSKLRSAVFKDVKDRVKGAAGKVKSGVKGMVKSARNKTANVLFKMADKIKKEGRELDMFDTVTAYLIDEGLVKDFDHAQRVMTTLDSTLIEEVHAEQIQLLEGYGGSTDKPMLVTKADKKGNTPAYQNMMKGMKSKVTGKDMYKKADHMESLEDAYLQVYAEKLDPMDFGKSKRTKEEKKKSRDEKKVNPVATKMYQRKHPAYGKKSTGL